jgi:hypothetical protein
MDPRTTWATPAAIVLAAVIVALGLAVGLRAPPSPSPAAPATAAPPVDRARVARHAAEALAYHRPLLLDRCWRPAAPRPAAAVFTFNLSFDARGEQVARGVVEEAGTSTPELTRCVVAVLPPLRVPPPGAGVQVEVPLRLP